MADPLTPLSLETLPPHLAGGVVAIGNFDGVHRGHQALLAATRSEARSRGLKALVLTFEPHPRDFFRPDPPVFRLTPPAAKARLLTALGFDGLVVLPFDRDLAAMEPGRFVEKVLVGGLGVAGAVVGHDFHFGRDRAGTPAFLGAAAARHGFRLAVLAPVVDTGGVPFSSSRIRALLEAGDVAAANEALGYRFFVLGTVIDGDKRGRELGYPTANIRLGADSRLRHGIYAVEMTRADGTVLEGVASYGRRPTFDDGPPLLEVFAFDFSGDLYGERVAVRFHTFLRGEEKFDSVAALIAQMDRDSAAARAILAEAAAPGPIDRALPAPL
ncbi:bifunctional riboflavin kinase/FAD synthetase [Prosthecomicrobium pneumaticum]|nr:bifunctional riboflavin kinase/FAD synthetase [Prosthecomicrobium pneumaticum]